MNRASTTPKTAASVSSSHIPGVASHNQPAAPRMSTHRIASLPMTARRGPKRSATTPPASINTALGNAPTAAANPAADGPPISAADQARARK